jgi:hypothetical protein
VNEFSYIDIFATKGLEYLLVLGFFLLLAAFWWLLSVPKKEIRKAQAEREELRRLLDVQRERMEAEIADLRERRDSMQNTLLARIQLLEEKALAIWNDTHAGASAPNDLLKLLDWVFAERDELAEDKRRLDYLTDLAQGQTSLYRKPGPDGSTVVDASGRGLGEGATLREAIDAARSDQPIVP